MKQLKGKVAVVTGVASGVGRELSILLAKAGCHLALVDVNQSGLAETVRMVEPYDVKVTSHCIDVSNRESMERLPEEVMKTHGHIHLVINNAAVALIDSILNGDLADFEWLMGVNFWGVVYSSKFFLPYLLKESEAHIVNVSSIFGLASVSSQATYCSAKFAVRGFTETLIAEMANSPVRVSCVFPGGVSTGIARNARFKKSFNCNRKEDMVTMHDKLTKLMPPQKAARILLRGIQKNRKRILIGPDAKIFSLVTRLFPASYHWLPRLFFKQMYPDTNYYKSAV